ncbi:unnamed protein product [Cylindrotheca closterium]|nr:unnamed protein product [Cylindrotheca closterium]
MEKKREGKAKKKVGPGDEGVGALETEMATKRARRKAGLGDEDLNDYWDPSGVTRNRKPNIGLSAEQVQLREQRMKRTDLKAVFASDKPTHHTEVFSTYVCSQKIFCKPPAKTRMQGV